MNNWEVYEGDWKSGKREGKGVLKLPTGSVYKGEFRDDKKEGKGIY